MTSIQRERPLSPHLQVYRPQLTSVLSILHRGTGVALAIGAFGISAWLLALAGGGETYATLHALLATPVGCLVVFAFAFCLMYHLLNGIRHLLWDIGWGLDIETTYLTGWTVVVLALASTGLIWWLAARAGGGA